ncbi:MAG TPA: hypothetical protein VI299_11585 [Polyangiales bacterium]
MSAHLADEELLAWAALAADDPARRAAHAHAATCSACRAKLREHEAMLSLLDGAFEQPVISDALAARVKARVYPRRWPRWVLVCTWLASLALVPFGGSHALGLQIGSHCVAAESAFAVMPLALAAWLTRAGRVQLDSASFAGIGGISGVLGQLWLRSACPIHDATYHSFMFHFLAVIALSAIGAAVGWKASAQSV